mmetsp:Transcript_23354/g.46049  ORF Transcript_23354/g.46049 Transcript_23354/m.46049 type:complete len:293 (+) Transcript_23354:251-1129(+)
MTSLLKMRLSSSILFLWTAPAAGSRTCTRQRLRHIALSPESLSRPLSTMLSGCLLPVEKSLGFICRCKKQRNPGFKKLLAKSLVSPGVTKARLSFVSRPSKATTMRCFCMEQKSLTARSKFPALGKRPKPLQLPNRELKVSPNLSRHSRRRRSQHHAKERKGQSKRRAAPQRLRRTRLCRLALFSLSNKPQQRQRGKPRPKQPLCRKLNLRKQQITTTKLLGGSVCSRLVQSSAMSTSLEFRLSSQPRMCASSSKNVGKLSMFTCPAHPQSLPTMITSRPGWQLRSLTKARP